MPQILESPANVLTAVDYFKAKLQFENPPAGVREIMKLPSVLLLDVREPEAFAREHIVGARNVPFDELPRRAWELPKDKTLILYGRRLTDALAAKAALELAHKGYKVQELAGGLEAWRQEGLPVEGGATERPSEDLSGEMASPQD